MISVHDSSYQRFVEKLREARIAAKISQEELARRLDRHQTFVSKIETSQRSLDLLDYLIWTREVGIEPLSFLEDFASEIQGRGARRVRRALLR